MYTLALSYILFNIKYTIFVNKNIEKYVINSANFTIFFSGEEVNSLLADLISRMPGNNDIQKRLLIKAEQFMVENQDHCFFQCHYCVTIKVRFTGAVGMSL